MTARGWPARLQQERVGLRPLARGDAAAWRDVRARNRAWLTPWEATLPPGVERAPQSFGAMHRELNRQARVGRTLPFATTWDDRLIGQVTVSSITWGSARSASIGYWIDAAHAGRGITPLAVAMAIDHCLGAVGLHRVEVAIRPENVASLRVVDKLGLRREGAAPRYLHIDGQWRDHLLFAVTREEIPEGLVTRLQRLSHPSQQ